MNTELRVILFILPSLFIATSMYAQKSPEELANINAPYYNIDEDSLALNGYDPTEYFLSNKALAGFSEYQLRYKGASYYFVSDENRTLFKQSPEKYLPEFGGYCAYGMGMKFGDGLNGNPPGKYPVNPETFKIIEDRLYLFYNDHGYNFLEVWETNELENLERAKMRWEAINH